MTTEVLEQVAAATAVRDPAAGDRRLGTVAVVGLGNGGLAAAVAFGRHRWTIGYDVSPARVEALMRRADTSGAVSARAFGQARYLWVTHNPAQLACADYVLVAVPTPLGEARRPDLSALEAATRAVGRHLKAGAVVIFSSTVYPGATEEVCVPILESTSGRRWRHGFHVGYSPERAQAVDEPSGLGAVPRLVAGDDASTLERVATLLASVSPGGVRRISSLRAAEAAKVAESCLHDLQLAAVNELALILERLDLEATEVLGALEMGARGATARPGMTGGRPIGVDPYHLAYAAQRAGHVPELILAGRRINESMAEHVAARTVHLLARADRAESRGCVNVLGLAHSENCADVRNSPVIGLVRALERRGVHSFVHDPLVDPAEALRCCEVSLSSWEELPSADALILAVAHRRLLEIPLSAYLQKIVGGGHVIDVQGVLDAHTLRRAGLSVSRL